jgi:hypothetical protein
MTVVDDRDGEGDEELPMPVPRCSPVLSVNVGMALALGALSA